MKDEVVVGIDEDSHDPSEVSQFLQVHELTQKTTSSFVSCVPVLIHVLSAIFIVLLVRGLLPYYLGQLRNTSLYVIPPQHKTFVLVVVLIRLKGIADVQVRLTFLIEREHLREGSFVGQ